MQKKAVNLVLIAIFLFVGMYIGIFIGRMSAGGMQKVHYESSEANNMTIYRIDLNATTAKELEEVPGITPQIAINIIEYRKEYGNYLEVEELMDVSGISDTLYAQIKGYFTVGGSK